MPASFKNISMLFRFIYLSFLFYSIGFCYEKDTDLSDAIRDAANDLANNRASIKTVGLVDGGLNVDPVTGLPCHNYGCMGPERYVSYYNKIIVSNVIENGLPRNSKKQWLELLKRMPEYFSLNRAHSVVLASNFQIFDSYLTNIGDAELFVTNTGVDTNNRLSYSLYLKPLNTKKSRNLVILTEGSLVTILLGPENSYIVLVEIKRSTTNVEAFYKAYDLINGSYLGSKFDRNQSFLAKFLSKYFWRLGF